MSDGMMTRRSVMGLLGSAAGAAALAGTSAFAQGKGELTVALPRWCREGPRDGTLCEDADRRKRLHRKSR